MMICVIALLNSMYVNAQQTKIDSLKKLIESTKTDTAKIDLYAELGDAFYVDKKMDSAVFSYLKAIQLNQEYSYSPIKLCWHTAALDYRFYEMGNYAKSLDYAERNVVLSSQLKDTIQLAAAYMVIAHNYKELGDYQKALNNYLKAFDCWINLQIGRHERPRNTYITLSISQVYLKMTMLDSALQYAKKGYTQSIEDSAARITLLAERILGDIYFAKGDDETALRYYRQYIPGYTTYKETNRDLAFVLNSMARVFQKRNQPDSAVFYAKKALNSASEHQDQQNVYDAATALSEMYANKNEHKKSSTQKDNADHINIPGNKTDETKIDSLKKLISKTKADTSKITLYEILGQLYHNEKKHDSSVLSYQQALEINERNNYSLQRQCWDMAALDYLLYEMGNYTESLKYTARNVELCKNLKDTFQMGFCHATFGHDYKALGEYRLSLNHYFKARQLFKLYLQVRNVAESDPYIIQCIGDVYLRMNQLDSALIYTQQSLVQKGLDPGNELYSIRILGDIYRAKGDDQRALNYYREYIPGFIKYNTPDFIEYHQNSRDLGFVFNSMAKIFQKRGETDSAIFYAKKALTNAEEYHDQQNVYDASDVLYNLNDSLHNESLAFKYFKIAEAAKDSMASIEKIRQIQSLEFAEQTREKEQQEADARQAAKTKRLIIITSILVSIIAFLIWNRIRQLRLRYKSILEQKESEKLKTQLLELEAKALRAQMNPHFIFNCMNSIKLLMQQNDNDKAINYLTTFSKLIRTIFQNSDKREITLYDEIETCKLYTRLESMRFADKFSYAFSIDETIDLKLLMVPALIIQPFIENAIWHGIMPKEDGGCVEVIIKRNGENVLCIIDDDGIGRETSTQNKFKTDAHESKGMHLTQSRIDLDNLINQRNASLEIVDKKDEQNITTGTKVILTFKEY